MGVRGIKGISGFNMMPRVFTIVASMVLATIVLAITASFTSNKWLSITTGAIAITTALTTIATAILLSDDFTHH